MTAPQPATLEREREKLYVTDAELIRRLGVPEKLGRANLRAFDADPKSGFPPKQEMFAHRRYWPAVEAWFNANHQGAPPIENEEEDEPQELIGNVYFLASPTHVKIGFSAGVRKRLRSLRSSHYETLELLTVIGNVPKHLEANLHKKFAAHRVHPRKEWFRRVPEIEEFVELVRTQHSNAWRKELLP